MTTANTTKHWIDQLAIYFMAALILFQQTSCSYVVQPIPVSNDILYNTTLIDDNTAFFITTENMNYRAINIQLYSDRIEGDLVPLTYKEIRLLKNLEAESGTSPGVFKLPNVNNIIRMYTSRLDIKSSNDFEFLVSFDHVQSIRAFELDEKMLWAEISNTVSAISLVSIPFALLLILFALKSSCPFLYTLEDEQLVLQGELFPGAIFQPLERTDFLALPFPQPNDANVLSVQIANKLQEVQHINKVSVWGIPTATNETAIMSQRGIAYTYANTISPTHLKNSDESSVSLSSTAPYAFLTHAMENNQLTSLSARFDLPANTENALLVLNAKNHEWLEFMWYDLSKKLGSEYMNFVEMHRNSSPDFLNNWLSENGLKLNVQVLEDNKWVSIGAFEVAGPLAFRQMALEIPNNYLQQETVQIRLQSGFHFWEVSDLTLAINPQRAKKEKAELVVAEDNYGATHLTALAQVDDNYTLQPQRGDYLNLSFQLPAHWTHKNTTLFFEAAGYYEHQRDFKQAPDLTAVRELLIGTGFTEASFDLLKRGMRKNVKDEQPLVAAVK